MVAVANDRCRARTAATSTTRTPDSIAPRGPCTALVACGAQAPRVVTWVATPRLALDLAPISKYYIITFCPPTPKPQSAHGAGPPAVLPAVLALPQPKQPLLLLPPPPKTLSPDGGGLTEHSVPPAAGAGAEPRQPTAGMPAGVADALEQLMLTLAGADAAPPAREPVPATRQQMAFMNRPQPAQVRSHFGVLLQKNVKCSWS